MTAVLQARATQHGVILHGKALRVDVTLDNAEAPKLTVTEAAASVRLRWLAAAIAWVVFPDLLARLVSSAWTLQLQSFLSPSTGATPVAQLVAALGLWCAPAASGWWHRCALAGRRKLQWHGAEHLALTGQLLASNCGTVVHSRAAALTGLTTVAVASACVARPDAIETWWPCARPTISALAWWSALQLSNRAPLDSATKWLLQQVVLPPSSEMVAACRAGLRALTGAPTQLRFCGSVATSAPAGIEKRPAQSPQPWPIRPQQPART